MTDDFPNQLRKQFSMDRVYETPDFVMALYVNERDHAADIIENQQKRIEQLEADIGALKAAFRVNMLRANASHEEIDAVIRAALGEKKDV